MDDITQTGHLLAARQRRWRRILALLWALCLLFGAAVGLLAPVAQLRVPEPVTYDWAGTVTPADVSWTLEQALHTIRMGPADNAGIVAMTLQNADDVYWDDNFDEVPDFITEGEARWAMERQWNVRSPSGVRRALVRLADQAATDQAAGNPGLAWDLMQSMALTDYAYIVGWMSPEDATALTNDYKRAVLAHYHTTGEVAADVLSVCIGDGWGQFPSREETLIKLSFGNFTSNVTTDYSLWDAALQNVSEEQKKGSVARIQQKVGLLPGGEEPLMTPLEAHLALPAGRLLGPMALGAFAIGIPLAVGAWLLYWWNTRAVRARLQQWVYKQYGVQDVADVSFDQLQALMSADDLLLDEIRRACRGGAKGGNAR